MKILTKIKNKLIRLYRQHILRDEFFLEASRWVKDKGDTTHRLNYPLTTNSTVFDLGGYHGDFAHAIHQRFGCKVYVFEPVPEFHKKCVDRFQSNKDIICLNYGLGSTDAWINISMAENSSSTIVGTFDISAQKVHIKSVTDTIAEIGVTKIDLLKINIEGGEFDVIPAMIASADIKKVNFLQVQFHNFVHKAVEMRTDIRSELKATHDEMWSYNFVWESWSLKRNAL
jgi:FkbM family methyltransferase